MFTDSTYIVIFIIHYKWINFTLLQSTGHLHIFSIVQIHDVGVFVCFNVM